MSGNQHEYPPIRKCQCGICDTTFRDDSVVAIAKEVARHWNEEHGDELRFDEKSFDTIEYGGRHLHGDEYAVTRKELYVTTYDVLNPDGKKPFKYAYVKKLESKDVCEGCWRSINGVDGYREIDNNGCRTKYRCDDCQRERQIEQRKEENYSMGEFA